MFKYVWIFLLIGSDIIWLAISILTTKKNCEDYDVIDINEFLDVDICLSLIIWLIVNVLVVGGISLAVYIQGV